MNKSVMTKINMRDVKLELIHSGLSKDMANKVAEEKKAKDMEELEKAHEYQCHCTDCYGYDSCCDTDNEPEECSFEHLVYYDPECRCDENLDEPGYECFHCEHKRYKKMDRENERDRRLKSRRQEDRMNEIAGSTYNSRFYC